MSACCCARFYRTIGRCRFLAHVSLGLLTHRTVDEVAVPGDQPLMMRSKAWMMLRCRRLDAAMRRLAAEGDVSV